MTSNYIFKNRSELMEATNLWRTDPISAKATYGEMNTWDVSGVTNFSTLFWYWPRFNEDISNWDVSNGTDFHGMFKQAVAFNSDLSGWDVSNGTDFSVMFSSTWLFNSDLSGWDVSNGTNFTMMFSGTKSFNADISGWDVSSGINFTAMFQSNSHFDINDINSWKVSEDADLSHMFGYNNTPSFSEFNQTLNISGHQVGTSYNLAYIKDYDGNLHANTGSVSDATKTSYKYQGLIDVNADGIKEAIYTNKESERWVTASINSSTGEIDYSDHGQGGTTRVVGIYIDPLVTSGEVVQGSDYDSQRRFQNDLKIDNLIAKTSGDYDGDGFQEVYWKTNDGTAYLRALIHADGNIQYANYQSGDQMSDYLTSKGFESEINSII